MANAYRKLLADAIESNGGYSRGYHERYALSWDVSLDCDVPDADDLIADRRIDKDNSMWAQLQWNHGITKEQFYAVVALGTVMEWAEEWDDEAKKGRIWEWVRDDMAEAFHGSVKGTSYASVSPDVAKRYGLAYYSPKRFVRKTAADMAYYPAKVAGWKIEGQFDKVPNFDATFEFHGRGGKHLCLSEFEGRSLEHSSDQLAEAIRNDSDEWDRGNYPNKWCQKLLAYIAECDEMFDHKHVRKEFEHQVCYRAADELHDLYEQAAAEAKEAAEVQWWAERDVVTK